MKHARRTLFTCLGYGCLVGSLLVSHAALAAPGATYVRNVTGTADGGTWVRVETRAAWTTLDAKRYTTLPVQVSKTTLRQGAIHALSRGVMHPGLHLAVAAAGFIIANKNILKENEDYQEYIQFLSDNLVEGERYRVYMNYSATCAGGSMNQVTYDSALSDISGKSNINTTIIDDMPCVSYPNGHLQSAKSYYFRSGFTSGGFVYGGDLESEPYVPLSESDYESIDPHIPVDIVQDLYGNNFAIPQWKDAISVMGQPASNVDSSGQIMPEVASAVGKWGENMDAQSQGQEAPHPNDPDSWRTPQEEWYDRELEDGGEAPPGWDGDIPPFDEPEINWQTETLELPSWSSGIGGGSCPGPRTIPAPMGGSFTIELQPACDLAVMVKPAVIGVAGFIALLIVVRARGGA